MPPLHPRTDTSVPPTRADYDTPWKIAVERYFRPFMLFYFADIAALIDWSRGYTFLDGELKRIARKAKTGKRQVDKLVKVVRQDGTEDWLYLHLEVQTEKDPEFAERIFTYHYRIYDYYRRPAESLALLCDDDPNWQPDSFAYQVIHTRIGFAFKAIKMTTFAGQESALDQSDNPFAWLTLAWLQTRATRGDMGRRLGVKFGLIRALFRQFGDTPERHDFLRVMDWMMTLPEELEQRLDNMIENFEAEKKVEYVDSIIRIRMERQKKAALMQGEQKGRQEGRANTLVDILEQRFGTVPGQISEKIKQAGEADLRTWVSRALSAPDLETVFQPGAN